MGIEFRVESPPPGEVPTGAQESEASEAYTVRIEPGYIEIDSDGAEPVRLDLARAGIDGVVDANGVPVIDDPLGAMVLTAGIFGLLFLSEESTQLLIESSQKSIEADKASRELNDQQQVKNIEDWIKKCAEAAAQARKGGFFGFIGKIAGFVGLAAGLGLIASMPGIKQTPLQAALSKFAFLTIALTVASQISQQAGGPALDLNSLVRGALTQMLTAAGMDQAKAESAAKIMIGFAGGLGDASAVGAGMSELAKELGADPEQAMIVSAVFMVTASLATLAAMSVMTGGLSSPTQLQQLMSITHKIAAVAQGLSAIGQGAINLELAETTQDANELQALLHQLRAMAEQLQAQLQIETDVLKEIMQRSADITRVLNDILTEAGQSQRQAAGGQVPSAV